MRRASLLLPVSNNIKSYNSDPISLVPARTKHNIASAVCQRRNERNKARLWVPPPLRLSSNDVYVAITGIAHWKGHMDDESKELDASSCRSSHAVSHILLRARGGRWPVPGGMHAAPPFLASAHPGIDGGGFAAGRRGRSPCRRRPLSVMAGENDKRAETSRERHQSEKDYDDEVVAIDHATPDDDGTRSVEERLSINRSEAEALRYAASITNPGGQGGVGITDPCWRRLTGRNGEGNGSLAWYLLEVLQADPQKIKKLVRRHPRVLLGKSSAAVAQVSEWLQSELGMDKAEVLRLLLKFPTAGHLKVETNIAPKCWWLRENVQTDNRGVARIILAVPQVLGLGIKRRLAARLEWVETRLGLSRERAAKLLRTHPVIFTLSIEKNMEPMLEWLMDRMRIDDEEAAAMVVAAPTILGMNPYSGLEPKLIWFRDRAGMTPTEVAAVIRRSPLILRRSIAKCLEPKLEWLQVGLRLDAEAAKHVLLRYPSLTGASLELNLKLKAPWFAETLGMSLDEAVGLLARCPNLLHLSLKENLEPTLRFYRESMGATVEELRTDVLANPRLISSSLRRRLIPRVGAMRRVGIKPRFDKHKNQVVMWPDVQFNEFLSNHGQASEGQDDDMMIRSGCDV